MASILIVDDNSANLELMLYLLKHFGHTVVGCSDGLAGIAAAKTGTFDIVLCDILMPGIDGYEFARRLKSDPELKRTPLIAVTALAMAGDRERVTEAGFDGYIGKPIEPENFVRLVEAFLQGAE